MRLGWRAPLGYCKNTFISFELEADTHQIWYLVSNDLSADCWLEQQVMERSSPTSNVTVMTKLACFCFALRTRVERPLRTRAILSKSSHSRLAN